MNLKFFFSLILLTLLACQKKDINALRRDLDDQKNRIAALEKAVSAVNGDIQALKAIAEA